MAAVFEGSSQEDVAELGAATDDAVEVEFIEAVELESDVNSEDEETDDVDDEEEDDEEDEDGDGDRFE